MKKMFVLAFSLICVLIVKSNALSEDYYQGRTIRIIVPASPGGTYDRMARLAARYMPRHIPGTPTLIVQNITGGGGMIGTRAAYNARPDGLTLLHVSALYSFQALTGKVKDIDYLKWGWLGSVGGAHYVFFVRSETPYRSIEEFRKAAEPVKVGIMGPGSSITDSAKMLKEFGKLNIRLVRGYKGYAPIALAVRQNEVDGVSTAALTLEANSLTRSMYSEKLITLITSLGGANPPPQFASAIAKLPKFRDFISDPVERQAFDTYLSTFSITRPFAAPPNTAEKQLSILRKALSDMTQDPEFIAAAEKNGFVLNPVGPEAVTTQIRSIFQLPHPVTEKLKEVFK